MVDALNGNVIYLHGNHDITVTQADLDKIPTGGPGITLVDDVYLDDGIVFTHGHLSTMFNAPDGRYPGEVPVGHFVTRAISYYLDNLAPAGADGGEPAQSRLALRRQPAKPDSRTRASTPQPVDHERTARLHRCALRNAREPAILMSDGTTSSIAEAKVKYDGLWTEWANANGGGEAGATVAAKAAQADYDGTYMAWFAQKFAFERGASGTVMGHTHIPKSGIQNSSCLYANSGLECPSIPEIAETGRARFSFTRRRSLAGSPESLAGRGERKRNLCHYGISWAHRPIRRCSYPSADFSCYVTITNDGSDDL